MSDILGEIRGRRILVVEDEYLIALDLAQRLEDLGAMVIGPAARADDAIRLLTVDPQIDAAVLDVHLGGENVYRVAERLRAQGVRFVFATGYRGEAISREYADVQRLEKPIDIRALVVALR
jgi:CheY-like chemotaxis protein